MMDELSIKMVNVMSSHVMVRVTVITRIVKSNTTKGRDTGIKEDIVVIVCLKIVEMGGCIESAAIRAAEIGLEGT